MAEVFPVPTSEESDSLLLSCGFVGTVPSGGGGGDVRCSPVVLSSGESDGSGGGL